MALDPDLFGPLPPCGRPGVASAGDYAGRVFRWAVLRGLRAMEAEDAAQEVLAIACRRIVTAAAAFIAWLYQITRRVVANARRKVGWLRRCSRGASA
ncbi:MAG: sigma factor [bacterium]